MRPLKITYLVEDTEQSGGVRVQLVHADALIARGHRVRMVTKGPPLRWRSSCAEWIYVEDFRQYDASDEDFVVGTFWLTVPYAHALAGERAVHLCQGYEGGFSVYEPIRDQIEAVYSLPIPKLVVARSLVDVCRRFTADVTYIGQVVEEDFYRDATPSMHEPPRVLLYGQSQADLRGIQDGYAAVTHARRQGRDLDLIRVSPWAPSDEELLENIREFHVALPTTEMTRLMHSCDVLLAPNHREEGFGLPVAEAMASGIPCVLTAIPSFLSFDERRDYALFAPEKRPVELGERLSELLSDHALRERLRTRGREVAEQWRVHNAVDRLEQFFLSRRSR